ncbi:MAG: hypothetical protein KDB80_08010 [Planctomycetes bacterium]|nr:hypothetical protein [Planctomycetota bacterium]
MIVGGVVGVVALVAIVAFLIGGGGDQGTKAAENGNRQAESSVPAPEPRADSPRKADKVGKTPDRPAPEIADEVWDRVNRMYHDAKQKHDEGVKARSSGETARYTTLIKESFDLIQAINAELEPYTTWLEEAVLEGWAMPGAYVELEGKLGTIDKLGSRVQKLKQR